MTDSIFSSVKKVVGLLGDDGSFDEDILLHINSVVRVYGWTNQGPA